MNKRTKIILGVSIIFAVILVALLILLAIVKGKNISVKPPIETEESESGEVEININRDSLDEFGKIYYDNIYECAYLDIDCTFSGDCFLDDDYFAKAYANSSKEELQFSGYITPKYIEFTYSDVFFTTLGESMYLCDKGIFINLTHLESAYQTLNGNSRKLFGNYDNYLLKIDNEEYSGFDIKAMFLDAILNSDYTLGNVGEDWAISVNGGLKSSYDNYIGNFINTKLNENMVISISTDGEYGSRFTTLYCEGETYSFEITFEEYSTFPSNVDFDTFTIFEESELSIFLTEIRAVFGENVYEYLD